MNDVRKLTRSRDDRWIGGVCGGLGSYFAIDPLIIRLIFLVAALAGVGTGIVVYVVMWLVVPTEG